MGFGLENLAAVPLAALQALRNAVFRFSVAGSGDLLKNLQFSRDAADRRVAITPNAGNEATQVQEPSVWFYGGLWHMLYTGGSGSTHYLFYASAASLDALWTKAGTQVIGGGQGGHSTGAYHSFVLVDGDTLYCYFVDEADGSLLKVAVANAATPTVWVKNAKTFALPSGMTQWGNVGILKDGAVYRIMMEGSTAAASWQMAYGTLDAPLGTITVITNPVTQLRPSAGNATATVSGAQLFKEGADYVLYFHAGRSGSLPTEIYRATTSDFATWTLSNNGYPIIERAHAFEVDQVADIHMVQDPATGRWYAFYTAMDNSQVKAKIMVLPAVVVDVDAAGRPTAPRSSGQRITDPQKKAVKQAVTDISVAATTFADLGALEVKFIPRGTAVVVTLAGVGTNGTGSAINYFQVTDGGSIVKAMGGYTASGAGTQFGINSVALITGLTPGQRYSLKMQCKVSAGAFISRPVAVADKELLAMIVEDAEWPLLPA